MGVEDTTDAAPDLHGSELSLSKIIDAVDVEALRRQQLPEHIPIFGHSPMQLCSEHDIGWKRGRSARRETQEKATQQRPQEQVYVCIPPVLPWEKRLYGAARMVDARRESPPRASFINIARWRSQGQPSTSNSVKSEGRGYK